MITHPRGLDKIDKICYNYLLKDKILLYEIMKSK